MSEELGSHPGDGRPEGRRHLLAVLRRDALSLALVCLSAYTADNGEGRRLSRELLAAVQAMGEAEDERVRAIMTSTAARLLPAVARHLARSESSTADTVRGLTPVQAVRPYMLFLLLTLGRALLDAEPAGRRAGLLDALAESAVTLLVHDSPEDEADVAGLLCRSMNPIRQALEVLQEAAWTEARAQ